MLVTAIVDFDKKRKKIYLDYEYFFFLYNSELRKYGISEGVELEDSIFKELNDDVIVKRAKKRALYILKSTQKTERQLKDKLIENGYSEYHAVLAVEYAKSFGYINDENYVRYYIECAQDRKSKKDIECSLVRRGISKDIIETVIEEFDFDEKEALLTALRKKGLYPEQLDNLEINEKNKIYAFLMRKGFSMESIKKILYSL